MKNTLITFGKKAEKFVNMLEKLCILKQKNTFYRPGVNYLYVSEYNFNWINPITYLLVIPLIMLNFIVCVGYGLYQFFNTSITIKLEQ